MKNMLAGLNLLAKIIGEDNCRIGVNVDGNLSVIPMVAVKMPPEDYIDFANTMESYGWSYDEGVFMFYLSVLCG